MGSRWGSRGGWAGLPSPDGPAAAAAAKPEQMDLGKPPRVEDSGVRMGGWVTSFDRKGRIQLGVGPVMAGQMALNGNLLPRLVDLKSTSL